VSFGRCLTRDVKFNVSPNSLPERKGLKLPSDTFPMVLTTMLLNVIGVLSMLQEKPAAVYVATGALTHIAAHAGDPISEIVVRAAASRHVGFVLGAPPQIKPYRKAPPVNLVAANCGQLSAFSNQFC
jgi:hypothetical protein